MFVREETPVRKEELQSGGARNPLEFMYNTFNGHSISCAVEQVRVKKLPTTTIQFTSNRSIRHLKPRKENVCCDDNQQTNVLMHHRHLLSYRERELAEVVVEETSQIDKETLFDVLMDRPE